ncbi:MAG TPA: glycosyltransferase family 4 protein [Pengzhenrongella sp.]
MRIGLISPPWIPVPPPAYGGIEAVVDVLARGLVAAGHEVLLAAPSDSTCPVPRVPGLHPSQPERLGETAPELRHVVQAYAAMTDVDIVHDHTVAGPLFAHRPARPIAVTTMHLPVKYEMAELYRAMSKDVAVVAISHHQAASAWGLQVARVIHHGLDVVDIPVGTGTGGYACFLGRMHPSKGVREAILIARRAGVPLRIAGKMIEPREKKYFRDCIAPLLGSDAEYVGELGAAEKYELLGGAIALVNPIAWPEPFGLVMIESLATGTPVLSTHQGSAPELVDHGVTGYLRNDIEGLADALGRVGELDRTKCRQVAETRFTTARMVADHISLYADLLARRAASPTPGPRVPPLHLTRPSSPVAGQPSMSTV